MGCSSSGFVFFADDDAIPPRNPTLTMGSDEMSRFNDSRGCDNLGEETDMTISTPDLCDAFPNDVAACELQFCSFGKRTAFSGRIVTVKCFEDNSLVKEILATEGSGKVLVVDGGGSLRRALIGDQIGAAAAENHWQGVVIHGAVRDVNELNGLDIGIKALGAIPLKTDKRGEGQREIEVSFGGIRFVPGHYLVADNNGVIVAPKDIQNLGSP